MRFRDIKRQARQIVHENLNVDALYLVPAPEDAEGPYETPIPITVRVHSKHTALGDQLGTNFSYAEREEQIPKIIFLVSEVASPIRGAVVSVAAGEAYLVDTTEPTDDLSITARVTRLSAAKAAGLPVPGE